MTSRASVIADPDSPTMPSDLPGVIEKETSSTAACIGRDANSPQQAG